MLSFSKIWGPNSDITPFIFYSKQGDDLKVCIGEVEGMQEVSFLPQPRVIYMYISLFYRIWKKISLCSKQGEVRQFRETDRFNLKLGKTHTLPCSDQQTIFMQGVKEYLLFILQQLHGYFCHHCSLLSISDLSSLHAYHK